MENNKLKNKFKSFIGKNKSTLMTCNNVDNEIIIPVLLNMSIDDLSSVIFVFPTLTAAENGFSSLKKWLNFIGVDKELVFLPELGRLSNAILENESAVLKVLYNLINCDSDRSGWYVTSAMSCFAPAVSAAFVKNNIITLKKGESYNFTDLINQLVNMDYDNEFQVTVSGEFAVRGGLVDIFSPLAEQPARVEFWDDEIEDIRLFDPDTQKSVSSTDQYTIIRRSAIENEEETKCFLDYFSENKKVIIINPDSCQNHLKSFGEVSVINNYLNRTESTEMYYVLDSVESADKNGMDSKIHPLPMDSSGFLNEGINNSNRELCMQLRSQQIKQWLSFDYTIHLVSNGACDYIKQWCIDYQIPLESILIEDVDLPNGLFIPEIKYVLITEKELFFHTQRRKQVTSTRSKRISTESFNFSSYADLDIGDYAVHLTHGIGIFHGITEITLSGNVREVFELEYADDIKLYVPIWQASLVSRYIGSKKSVPTLNKIGGARWNKLKLSAMIAAQNMASEMLNIQSIRATRNGYKFTEDDHEQQIFEEAFPYQETPDQAKASVDMKNDMMSSKPMDRLICGDVGYGKTEVAMRGAFKAVMNGKQVAILVPTTILAQQHFYSFQERFAQYPVIIEMISRFRTKSEQKKILEDLAEGKIDIIIGTHRLAQKDVDFSALGLVIIDEEQRFGVIHKERVKKFRATVDVLTMTATPIPRTLHFAMSGLRDLSTIMTAPNDRLPVQTSVCQFNEKTIKTAIMREVQRDGQVFYLHNRVNTIDARCRQLQKIMPDITFAVGHGRMNDNELEDVVSLFIDGKIDVLVCTTIIESGVDIPNANTMIIERADRFGLAELYQLRGRVGRWSRQAYTYLLLPEHNILTGNARTRLAAIRKYTHLGAGFRLALKDLEIRGAGNILGAQQSGYINAIGFDLYCQLLKSTINRLKGGDEHKILPFVDLHFDFIDFGIRASKNRLIAGFSQDYIPSERIRVDMYRKFSSAASSEEILFFSSELKDRFGTIPTESSNFIRIMRLRLVVAQAGYNSLRVAEKLVFIEGGGKRIFLINGIVPKLKSKLLDEKLSELENMIYYSLAVKQKNRVS